MRHLAIATVFVLFAACGGRDATTTATEAPVETIIPDDPELRRSIYLTGVNAHGMVELPQERWVELAEAGCRQGAWEWGVAQDLGAQFLAQYDPAGVAPEEGIAQTVWLMTILGCRDLFPQAAIDRGPPLPAGP